MNTKLLAAAFALAIASGSAFARGNETTTSSPPPKGAQAELAQTGGGAIGAMSRPDMPVNPGATRHVIGGQTFFFGSGMSTGGDGAH